MIGGKALTLRYSHGIIGEFETAAFDELLKMKAIAPGTTVFADALIPGQLMNAKVLSLALLFGLKASEPDLDLTKISDMIDVFIDEGGDMRTLRRKVTEAFKLATDPNSVASILENWKSLDELEDLELLRIQTNAGENLKKARALSGSKPPDLGSANSE